MKRGLLLVVVALVGVVIGMCLTWIYWHRQAPVDPPAPVSVVPVQQLTVDDGGEHWRKHGFVEMTPPVHLPSDAVEADHIAVWLRIPDDKKITVRRQGEQALIKFPAGTTADRVESFLTDGGFSVVDVRGTTLTETGELWHVLVPADDARDGPLVGWEWPKNDDDAQAAATKLLVDHLRATHTLHDARAPKDKLVEEYRRNNACGRCHPADRALDLDNPGGIHRATDDSGFYVPLSVLTDANPLEIHRQRDMNTDDRFVSLECPSGQQPILDENDGGSRRYRCADGKVPVGTLDVTAALKAHDPHAVAVCAARKYLWDHMDNEARVPFAQVFMECGI